jgi:hypothetical protein
MLFLGFTALPASGEAQEDSCTDTNRDGQCDIVDVQSCIAAFLGLLPCTTCLPPRFVDNGDGTVTDGDTGLTWEKKGTEGGIHHVTHRYTWAGCCDGQCGTPVDPDNLCQPSDAAAVACAQQTGGALGCDQCPEGKTCDVDPDGVGAVTTIWEWLAQLNEMGLGGYSDWRVPGDMLVINGARLRAPQELETILLEPPVCSTSPCVDPIFGPTEAANYWSAATQAPDIESALAVSFETGDVSFQLKKDSYHVRAVRRFD